MKHFIILLSTIAAIGLMSSCSDAPKGAKTVAETAKKVAAPSTAAKTLKVNPGSRVEWTGSKLAGKHTGTLNVSGGTVNVEGGKVVSGNFTIDMKSLVCTDLKAGEGKEDLEGHLKNEDFFDVAKFPTAKFALTSINAGNVTGNLTIKDVTKSISFPATVTVTNDNVMVESADFTINRTDFGIKYGSASFFDNLKDKAINDQVGLKVRMRAH